MLIAAVEERGPLMFAEIAVRKAVNTGKDCPPTNATTQSREEVSGRQLKANYCETMSHSVWPQLIPDIGTRAANQVDKHDERCSNGNPEGQLPMRLRCHFPFAMEPVIVKHR
jgi:hypothetical protein